MARLRSRRKLAHRAELRGRSASEAPLGAAPTATNALFTIPSKHSRTERPAPIVIKRCTTPGRLARESGGPCTLFMPKSLLGIQRDDRGDLASVLDAIGEDDVRPVAPNGENLILSEAKTIRM